MRCHPEGSINMALSEMFADSQFALANGKEKRSVSFLSRSVLPRLSLAPVYDFRVFRLILAQINPGHLIPFFFANP